MVWPDQNYYFGLKLIGDAGEAARFFGLALETIGISLATFIMLGISIGVGTLGPLAAAGTKGSTVSAPVLLAAVMMAIGGALLCAHAGQTLR